MFRMKYYIECVTELVDKAIKVDSKCHVKRFCLGNQGCNPLIQ